MPLQAIAIKDFNTPLMRETTQKDELKIRIAKLYEQDRRYHDYASGSEAINNFETTFLAKAYSDTVLYVGMFNDKPICAIRCLMNQPRLDGSQMTKELSTGKLAHLVMHTENLNRGIEEQFIKLICQNKEVLFYSEMSEIQQIIDKNC